MISACSFKIILSKKLLAVCATDVKCYRCHLKKTEKNFKVCNFKRSLPYYELTLSISTFYIFHLPTIIVNYVI